MEIEKKLQGEKEWKTPELIVLMRSNPEEAVLGSCKLGEAGGPVGFDYGCEMVDRCVVCSATAGS